MPPSNGPMLTQPGAQLLWGQAEGRPTATQFAVKLVALFPDTWGARSGGGCGSATLGLLPTRGWLVVHKGCCCVVALTRPQTCGYTDDRWVFRGVKVLSGLQAAASAVEPHTREICACMQACISACLWACCWDVVLMISGSASVPAWTAPIVLCSVNSLHQQASQGVQTSAPHTGAAHACRPFIAVASQL